MNIHYEVAAAGFLLLVLLSYHRQKHLDIYRNKIFGLLVFLSVCAISLNIATGIIDRGGFPVWIQYLTVIVFFLVHMTVAVCYAYYVLAWTRNMELFVKKRFWLMIPYLVGCIVCVTTPWTQWLLQIDSNVTLQNGVVYSIALLYFILPAGYLIINPNRMKRRNYVLFLCFTVAIVSSSVAQYFLRDSTLIMYGIFSLVLFTCFLFIQGSDYYMDETTGFFKMHGFEEVLRERMTYQRPSSYLLIRIRNYTAMTEMYDYSRLSKIHQKIAQILRETRRRKCFYRIAASTFAVISESSEESHEIYADLVKKLPEVWTIDGEEIVHEYSFYVVDTAKDVDNTEQLLQRVSYARSDHRGHHKPGELIHLSNQTMELEQEKQKVAQLVEEAILDNSIEIYFQPVYSMKKGRITSLEVLARLKDKDKNFINPEFFIHVAEENRTIIQLGEQIYRKACVFASQNKIFDKGIEDININLSPVQCYYEGLAEDLVSIAAEYGIPMSRIHLEITESALNYRIEILTTLERLNAVGAEIALDDFGTGYSSITSIMSLPISYVKIDKSLIWSYSEGKNQFLNELIPMIQSEGKKIVAEGIETEEHIDILQKLNGDYLQGYYFSRPLPEKEFLRYLEEQNTL